MMTLLGTPGIYYGEEIGMTDFGMVRQRYMHWHNYARCTYALS